MGTFILLITSPGIEIYNTSEDKHASLVQLLQYVSIHIKLNTKALMTLI